VSTFRRYCLLPQGEEIDPRIMDLTGIKPSDLVGAQPIAAVLEDLVRWRGGIADQSPGGVLTNPFTWGGLDHIELCRQADVDHAGIFGRRFNDVKTVYVAWRMGQGKDHIKGGLARALTKFGLAFQGRIHDATDDSVNTFRAWMAMVKQFKLHETL
jgi:inhibitor of KinA sporulation pathway (predicted exonuclease)